MSATRKSPEISQEDFEFYTKKHCGKKIVIKVSGGEFEKPEFSQLINTVHLLLQNDIIVFLVFGGGAQIDTFYTEFSGKIREKKDGVGVTTAEVLAHGVVPAYEFLMQTLQNKFSDMPYSVNSLSPADLQVEEISGKMGWVANPVSIQLDESKELHMVGFVGEDSSGQKYNVNADEIALSITKTQKIDEVIFITGTGGILDNDGNILSEISEEDLEKMISGNFPNTNISGGMQKKCQEVLELLKQVPKVAMAKSETLQQELFTKKGAGTLCRRK